MDLHVDLRELVDRSGPEVLDDASSFRGMLEDLIGDDTMPASSVNLLVEAVRYRALDHVVRMVDNGADPDAAVRSAGERFAQERGGGDPERCSWACAVLGYALRRVDDATFARHSLLETRRTSATPPATPPSPPPAAGVFGTTRVPRPVDEAGTVLVPPSTPAAPAAAPRRRWIVAAGAASALVVAVVVAASAWQLSSRDSSSPDADASRADGSTPAATNGTADGAAELQSAGAETDMPAVADRYADLGRTLTADLSACLLLATSTSVEEQLSCSYAHGTLELTTYATLGDLERARTRQIDTRQGNLSDLHPQRSFYAFDPSIGESSEPPEIYWDSAASLLSAHLVGFTGYPYAELLADFEETSPTVGLPTEPRNPALIRLIDEFGLTDCERNHTYGLGESEESRCYLGDHTIFVARFGTRRDLRNYREYASAEQRADTAYAGPRVVCRQFDTDPVCGSAAREEIVGQIRGFISDDGSDDESGVLYVDDSACGCYLEVWGYEGRGRGDPDALLGVLYPNFG